MTKYIANLSDIISAVSDEFGIPVKLITSPDKRTKPIAEARHVAIFLACKMTWLSKREIAASFNAADHSSLYYGLNKTIAQMAGSPETKKRIEGLAKRLESK